MNSCFRALTCFALFAVAMTTLNQMYPEAVRHFGLDFWNLPALQQEEQDSVRRFAELDASNPHLLLNCGGRARIIERVADGSLSLFEAAAAFRALNCGSGTAVPVAFRKNYPQASDEECLCRQVICWTRNHPRVTGDPQRIDQVVARLEAVLEEHLRAGTPIVLPPCPNP